MSSDVNGHQGHFYLTKLLLPTLQSTAKSSPPGAVRVVNVSSLAHIFYGLRFNTFKDGPARKRQSFMRAYGQSKFVSPGAWQDVITKPQREFRGISYSRPSSQG